MVMPISSSKKYAESLQPTLIYKPTLEDDEVFQKRFDCVQSLMIRMVLIGRKKGRPSKGEDNYEEAA